MTEVGPLAIECPENPGGIHVLENECIAEILDPISHQAGRTGNRGRARGDQPRPCWLTALSLSHGRPGDGRYGALSVRPKSPASERAASSGGSTTCSRFAGITSSRQHRSHPASVYGDRRVPHRRRNAPLDAAREDHDRAAERRRSRRARRRSQPGRQGSSALSGRRSSPLPRAICRGSS